MSSNHTSKKAQQYKQGVAKIGRTTSGGSDDDFYHIVGKIVIKFEECEDLMFEIISLHVKNEREVLRICTSSTSRSARLAQLDELISSGELLYDSNENTTFGRVYSFYKAIAKLRDSVAHSCLRLWKIDDKWPILILQPGFHKPKYFSGNIPLPNNSYQFSDLEEIQVKIDKLEYCLLSMRGAYQSYEDWSFSCSSYHREGYEEGLKSVVDKLDGKIPEPFNPGTILGWLTEDDDGNGQ